jgi:hypothetical protein
MLKKSEDGLGQEFVESLIGKMIYVPTNMHKTLNDIKEEIEDINVWFAGTVAGVERSLIKYDYVQDAFTDEVKESFTLLLTDGIGYILASDCEIKEITEEEFETLYDEHQKKQEALEGIDLDLGDLE